jgi:hypothetical protein
MRIATMMRAMAVLLLAVAAERAAATDLVEFARCLNRAGATFYTASWCPHCARQTRMFGSAIRYVNVVDCSDGCRGVNSFPTWRFADGSHISGVATLATLAARTRCRLDQPGHDETTDGGAQRSSRPIAPDARYVGGATIIDVPR